MTVFVAVLIWEGDKHGRADMVRNVSSLQHYFQVSRAQVVQKLTIIHSLLADNGELQAAFAAESRSRLLLLVQPIYQRMRSSYGVTHFAFYDKQQVNVYRGHQPDRYGDKATHVTLKQAHQSGELVEGVESDSRGNVSQRVVVPIQMGGEPLGYLELGYELGPLVEEMADAFDVDMVMMVDKQNLRADDWEAGMRFLGREADWSLMGDRVIAKKTAEIPADVLADWMRGYTADLAEQPVMSWRKRYFRLGAFSLRDVGDRQIGQLFVLRDVSMRIHETEKLVALLGAGGLLLGGFLFAFFYRHLGRTEDQLMVFQAKTQDSQDRLVNAQRIAHFGSWEWDVQQDQVECSSEATHILGLDATHAATCFRDLLARVHPEDRQVFDRFVHTVCAERKKDDLVHRVIGSDGRHRVVHHRAEWVHDSAGRSQRMNATVHDITDRKQAETMSVRMGRILANSWSEIYVFDADTLQFIDVSEGACRNLGYTLEELRQLTPVDLKPEYDPEQFQALLEPLRLDEEAQFCIETEHKRKDGSCYPTEICIQYSGSEMPPVFVAIVQDISERKHYIAELEHKALYDELTGLLNRNLLQERLSQAIKEAQKEQTPLALLQINVMRLKEINDILGHQQGDQVLQEVAVRLRGVLREADALGRLAGGEFAIVLPDMAQEHVATTARKLQALFEQPVSLGDIDFELEAAIGVAMYPEHGDEAGVLLQHADIAMRVAKQETGDFSLYAPDNDSSSLRRLQLYGELRRAITEQQLELHYQPKIDVRTGQIKSVEALARWTHPSEGMIPPYEFIPMVEQSGLIRPFTLWVLEQAVRQCKRWSDAGIDLDVAVNLSTRNLLDPTLPESLAELLETEQLESSRLMLEITESAVMARPEQSIKILEKLYSLGIKLSIDDFGTGYSSLAYLKKLPVHELKIDQSFVFGLANNENDAVIVRSTIDLAHNLGLSVVAEGVEDQEILGLLEVLCCDIAQGYHFSRPLPAAELEQWLTNSVWGYPAKKAG